MDLRPTTPRRSGAAVFTPTGEEASSLTAGTVERMSLARRMT